MIIITSEVLQVINHQLTRSTIEHSAVMHKVKFKPKKNHDKSNTQKQNENGGGERYKSNETSFAQTQIHEKVLLIWFRLTESAAKKVHRGLCHGLPTAKSRQGHKKERVNLPWQKDKLHIAFIMYVLKLY